MLAPLSRLICHVIAPLVPAEGCPAFLCYLLLLVLLLASNYCTTPGWARASWLGLSALVVLPRLRHRSRLTPRPVTGPRAPLCTTVTAEATEATASKSRWAMCTALHTINTGFLLRFHESFFSFENRKARLESLYGGAYYILAPKFHNPKQFFVRFSRVFFLLIIFWNWKASRENHCWTPFLKFSICYYIFVWFKKTWTIRSSVLLLRADCSSFFESDVTSQRNRKVDFAQNWILTATDRRNFPAYEAWSLKIEKNTIC